MCDVFLTVSVGDNVEEPGLDKPHLLDPQLMVISLVKDFHCDVTEI